MQTIWIKLNKSVFKCKGMEISYKIYERGLEIKMKTDHTIEFL